MVSGWIIVIFVLDPIEVDETAVSQCFSNV